MSTGLLPAPVDAAPRSRSHPVIAAISDATRIPTFAASSSGEPFLQEQGFSVRVPLEGLSFGRQLQRLKELAGDSYAER